jgi:hypothetical protein
MLLSTLLNALVIGVSVFIITKGQSLPDLSILIGLPLGLGLLSGILFLLLGFFSLIISLGIAVFALRWAFNLETKQSLIVTGIWCVWQTIYALL